MEDASQSTASISSLLNAPIRKAIPWAEVESMQRVMLGAQSGAKFSLQQSLVRAQQT